MKLLAEGAEYYPTHATDSSLPDSKKVPKDYWALVDRDDVLLVLGSRDTIVTKLAEVLIEGGLETMAVTWADPPTLDISGKTVYL